MGSGGAKRQRSCIACGEHGDKRGLFRIVRSPEGGVSFDATGNAAGRGAYLCSPACLDAAMKRGKIQRALRAEVGREELERIAGELRAAMMQGERR